MYIVTFTTFKNLQIYNILIRQGVQQLFAREETLLKAKNC